MAINLPTEITSATGVVTIADQISIDNTSLADITATELQTALEEMRVLIMTGMLTPSHMQFFRNIISATLVDTNRLVGSRNAANNVIPQDDVLIFLSPTRITTATNLDPLPSTIRGGMTNRGTDNEFTFNTDLDNQYVYVAMRTATVVTSLGTDDFLFTYIGEGGEAITDLVFNNNFVVASNPRIAGYTVFEYDTTPTDATAVSQLTYKANTAFTIRRQQNERTVLQFGNGIDVNHAIANIDFNQLSSLLQSRLRDDSYLSDVQQQILSLFETSRSTATLDDTLNFQVIDGELTTNHSQYYNVQQSVGIYPAIVGRLIGILVDRRVNVTGVTNGTDTINVINEGVINDLNAFSVTLTATDEADIDTIVWKLVGTQSTVDVNGFNEQIKVERDNLHQQLINELGGSLQGLTETILPNNLHNFSDDLRLINADASNVNFVRTTNYPFITPIAAAFWDENRTTVTGNLLPSNITEDAINVTLSGGTAHFFDNTNQQNNTLFPNRNSYYSNGLVTFSNMTATPNSPFDNTLTPTANGKLVYLEFAVNATLTSSIPLIRFGSSNQPAFLVDSNGVYVRLQNQPADTTSLNVADGHWSLEEGGREQAFIDLDITSGSATVIVTLTRQISSGTETASVTITIADVDISTSSTNASVIFASDNFELPLSWHYRNYVGGGGMRIRDIDFNNRPFVGSTRLNITISAVRQSSSGYRDERIAGFINRNNGSNAFLLYIFESDESSEPLVDTVRYNTLLNGALNSTAPAGAIPRDSHFITSYRKTSEFDFRNIQLGGTSLSVSRLLIMESNRFVHDATITGMTAQAANFLSLLRHNVGEISSIFNQVPRADASINAIAAALWDEDRSGTDVANLLTDNVASPVTFTFPSNTVYAPNADNTAFPAASSFINGGELTVKPSTAELMPNLTFLDTGRSIPNLGLTTIPSGYNINQPRFRPALFKVIYCEFKPLSTLTSTYESFVQFTSGSNTHAGITVNSSNLAVRTTPVVDNTYVAQDPLAAGTPNYYLPVYRSRPSVQIGGFTHSFFKTQYPIDANMDSALNTLLRSQIEEETGVSPFGGVSRVTTYSAGQFWIPVSGMNFPSANVFPNENYDIFHVAPHFELFDYGEGWSNFSEERQARRGTPFVPNLKYKTRVNSQTKEIEIEMWDTNDANADPTAIGFSIKGIQQINYGTVGGVPNVTVAYYGQNIVDQLSSNPRGPAGTGTGVFLSDFPFVVTRTLVSPVFSNTNVGSLNTSRASNKMLLFTEMYSRNAPGRLSMTASNQSAYSIFEDPYVRIKSLLNSTTVTATDTNVPRNYYARPELKIGSTNTAITRLAVLQSARPLSNSELAALYNNADAWFGVLTRDSTGDHHYQLGTDLDFSASKSVIIPDTANGNRYRLTVTNGVLGVEYVD